MSQNTRTTPKRRIERVSCDISITPGTSSAVAVLHAAEDAKTLVRAVVILRYYTEANSGHRLKCLLAIRPNAVTVSSPITGAGLDVDVPLQNIAAWPMMAYGDTTSATPPAIVTDSFELDTKAMRKLKAGDQVVLHHIATGINSGLYGVIYLWFKE